MHLVVESEGQGWRQDSELVEAIVYVGTQAQIYIGS